MNKEQVIDLEMSRINSSFQGLFLSLSNGSRSLVNTDVSEVIANSGISINNMDILALIIHIWLGGGG